MEQKIITASNIEKVQEKNKTLTIQTQNHSENIIYATTSEEKKNDKLNEGEISDSWIQAERALLQQKRKELQREEELQQQEETKLKEGERILVQKFSNYLPYYHHLTIGNKNIGC